MVCTCTAHEPSMSFSRSTEQYPESPDVVGMDEDDSEEDVALPDYEEYDDEVDPNSPDSSVCVLVC